MIISFPLVAQDFQSITVGGLIRAGGFNLAESAENIESSISFNEEALANSLGKFLFVNYYYNRFGIGARWMSYQLEGLNDQYKQTLDLEYAFVTLAIRFLEGNYLHPDIVSRFGFIIGQGQNRFKLTTSAYQPMAGESAKDVTQSTADATLAELFFESHVKNGLGYRLGYFVINAEHDSIHNGYKTDASTQSSIYLTLIWQF